MFSFDKAVAKQKVELKAIDMDYLPSSYIDAPAVSTSEVSVPNTDAALVAPAKEIVPACNSPT